MGKKIGYTHNWVEVAPSPYISCQKTSNAPKLETILEEGSENLNFLNMKLIYVLPVLLSFASYVLINNYVFF
ncbi:hypothetical protein RND71_032179 [Anisodus tanguticus]|uniref:Transmembrane protein n=1 Tax=Anisodus tanguticus TaxID=243964 RepID=A0AAE1RC58_9SOLA|nr:hypothetical protein RND71_032179 [Anisodus tanguticus]